MRAQVAAKRPKLRHFANAGATQAGRETMLVLVPARSRRQRLGTPCPSYLSDCRAERRNPGPSNGTNGSICLPLLSVLVSKTGVIRHQGQVQEYVGLGGGRCCLPWGRRHSPSTLEEGSIPNSPFAIRKHVGLCRSARDAAGGKIRGASIERVNLPKGAGQ